jgi:hypothetical protein
MTLSVGYKGGKKRRSGSEFNYKKGLVPDRRFFPTLNKYDCHSERITQSGMNEESHIHEADH